MTTGLLDRMNARRGHFAFESGFHGDLHLDLDGFFDRPQALAPHISQLAEMIRPLRPHVICGPFTGGALVAYRVAEQVGAAFLGSERVEPPMREGLYPYRYRLGGDTSHVNQRRVIVVDDVINAGSAVGATPVGIAALMTLGTAASDMVENLGVPLISLAREEISLWEPRDCALCAQGLPLT